MDPIGKVIGAAYLSSLGLLSLWGGKLAWAQSTAAPLVVPAQHVATQVAGVPVTFDLGNLTAPSAIVICTVLVLRSLEKAGGFPLRVRVEIEEKK